MHVVLFLLLEIAPAKFKVCSESLTMNYDNKIIAHRTLDRKHVTLVHCLQC